MSIEQHMEIEKPLTESVKKIMKANQLKKLRKEFSKYEIIRKPGQPLSDNDKKWIVNFYSKMKISGDFFHFNETELWEKCSQYCSIGKKTLDKLIETDGDYTDDRGGDRCEKLIDSSHKEMIIDEIRCCFQGWIPISVKVLLKKTRSRRFRSG